jgi:hypothetical protein
VYNRLSGTITWLPAVGQVIKPGQALYRVDGAPVILMDGTTPAYRDLNSSDSDGQDILQLNRNLVALGFNPDGIVVDDVWQAATTAGVELYQESLGETETGSIALGKIVFLPGPQLISTVDATVGSNGSGGSNPSGSSASYEPSATPAPEFVDLKTTTAPTTTTTTPTQPKKQHKPHQNQSAQTIATLKALLKAATAQLQAETAQLRAAGKNNGSPSSGGSGKSPSSSGSGNNNNSGNSNNNSGNSNNGSGGGSATAILATTSTKLVVTVDLDATKQSEAKVGEPVTVELPNGNTVNGKVTAVSPIAQSSSNNGNNGNGGNGNNGNGNNGNGSSGATIPVTVSLSGHQAGAGLDQAAVSVNFSKAKASNVLSVPVTALLATAGGGYAVQAAAAPHTLIPVTTGLFAAGYVEISGAGIYPGLAVTDSQG